MKGLMTLVAIVALAAGGWFLFGGAAGGSKYGATPSAPLGKYGAIEARLVGAGLDKHPMEPTAVAHLFDQGLLTQADIKVTEFRDRVSGYRHYVAVVQDAGGKVVGVAGQVRSGAFEYSSVGSKCEVFLAKFWMSHCGEQPDFESKYDRSRGMVEYYQDDFKKSGVAGMWRKDSAGGDMMVSTQVHDKISFALN